ncbi:MAG: M6 family metalloprotease domain-containing protein [Nitrososphaerales archaeon]
MRIITFNVTILSILIYPIFCFAQVSPKEGVIPPAYFWEFNNMIQNEYSKGYYAEKFKERRETREKIEIGLLPKSILADDTVNAVTLMGQYTNLSGFYTQQQFQNHLYDGPNPTGTVTEYYSEVSYNQLYFTGDAKGWYTMPRTLEDYEGGNNGLGTQGGPRFVWDILQVSDPTLNYADYIQYYDTQGRPHIGFIAVIHSGGDAAAGGFNIWSHRWTFTVYSGSVFTTDDIDPVSGLNVIIDGDYAIMPERSGGSNGSGPIVEIGVFAHEFGHIFGIPDLYDTDGSSEGLGNWCLMAGGTYGGNGQSPETPVHMSAWVKKQLGWVTPTNITSYHDSLMVPNVEENPVIYRMWKDGSISNQYFLIENRQNIGFDINIYDDGFLIYHVDDNMSGNQNENRYLVDLEQADGFRHLNNGSGRGDSGDPFPGTSQNSRFDWNTNPNSKDYSLQNTVVSIRNIYKDGNMMVGDFEVGPRAGIYAFSDPGRIDFGEVENGTNSIIKPAILANYGIQDLIINNIPSSSGDFTLETALTFPIMLTTFDSLQLDFRFLPTVLGNVSEVYPVSSNDPNFNGFNVVGLSYNNYPALDKTFYASSGVQNNGEILTVDANTGVGTLLGPSSFDGVKSISIHPLTGSIYGLVSRTIEADIVKVSAGDGDSHLLFNLDLQQMAEIAFDTLGVLYGIQRNGLIYTIDLDFGTYNLVVDGEGTYSGTAFNPLTNELWATSANIVGVNMDAIFKVNITTGDTTIVGHTGLGKRTNDIVFDENGNLFGVIGSETEINDFISINSENGMGTVIGSVGFKNILGLAYEVTGITSVEDENDNSVPLNYNLSQNYPNPFNPTTRIEFSLPVESNVKLIVYNVLGQEIIRLIDDQMTAGNHSINWNASGNQVTSGIYFYELVASGTDEREFRSTKKMILLK